MTVTSTNRWQRARRRANVVHSLELRVLYFYLRSMTPHCGNIYRDEALIIAYITVYLFFFHHWCLHYADILIIQGIYYKIFSNDTFLMTYVNLYTIYFGIYHVTRLISCQKERLISFPAAIPSSEICNPRRRGGNSKVCDEFPIMAEV